LYEKKVKTVIVYNSISINKNYHL